MTATVESAPTAGRGVPLDPGDVVGAEEATRWQVVRHIADGGFSSVYEVQPATPATRLRHGPAHRALKCLWGTPAELTTIGGEAAKMAAVEGHDNVLGMIASFRFGLPAQPHADYAGLVLELASEDLPRFVARVHPSERAWAAVFEQVAAGLDHIHARRVVHGDIKPTNMLRVDGRFAVADFGVSAPLEATHSAGIGLSRTIAFWPPESASQGVAGPDGVRLPPTGGWRATRQGDVWALAVSMHRMLTGRHITPGTTPEQQYEFVCLGKYTLDDRLGPGWRRLLADCLVHEVDQRVVSTAADLRARLSELALTDQYAGVPWPDGRPRVVAVLDLGQPSAQPAARASLDPAAASTGASATPAPASAAPGSAPATPATLAVSAPAAASALAAAGSADVAATATPPSAATGPAGAGAAAVPTTPSGPAAAESRAALADAVAVPAAPGADPGTATTPGSGRATQPTSPGVGADPAPAPRAYGDPAPLADRRNDAMPAAASRGEVLVLYLTREGGRVHGAVLPGGGLLLDATRHLTDVAVPSLAQQVRDSQRALARRLDEQERLRAAGTAERLPDDAGSSTMIVDPNDADLTRELSVADAIRQRDQVLRDRDRLRQQYADLAHRLDRLERDRAQSERAGLDSPTAVLRAVVPGRAADRSTAPIRTVRPAAQPRRRRRHPVRTAVLLLVLLVVAAALGGLAVALATGRDPVDVLRQAVQPMLDWVG